METKKIYCEECQDLCEINGASCQACCPHGDLDHGVCMDCDLDKSEDIASRAYDLYKDRMKYGD